MFKLNNEFFAKINNYYGNARYNTDADNTSEKNKEISNRFKRWTSEDDDKLWELINKGTKMDDLISIFNRSWKSIFYRVKKLQLKYPISNEEWQRTMEKYDEVFNSRKKIKI